MFVKINGHVLLILYLPNYTIYKVKKQSPICHRTGHEGPEGKYRYSSTLSLTSALDGGG
jgi:hypothetical protein